MTEETTAGAETTSEAEARDWWGQFHLSAFLSLTHADEQVDRRELVWIKRFFIHQKRLELYEQLEEALEHDRFDTARLERFGALAAEKLAMSEKRRFVYNLAQMCKSKGDISVAEYNVILDLAERIGIHDTDADAIINSVFSINDTFTTILGLLALGVILKTTKVVIVPLVIAVFITMIVNRVESRISGILRMRRGRMINKLGAVVAILFLLFMLVMAAISSGKDISKRYPYYEKKISVTLKKAENAAIYHDIPLPDASGLIERAKELPIGKTIKDLLSSLVDLVADFMLIVIFTCFLVFSGASYRGILQEMNEKISAYISIKTIISLLTGVAVFVACTLFGTDFALFWAILAFLLNFIPSVGSIIATIPPILLAMIQFDSWTTVTSFSVTFVLIQLVIGQVLEPKLMGSKLAVKPVAILLGLIFWGFLWGIPGMFLAAPLMALLRILSSYFNFSRNFERLLAAD